jgi:AcrR family transcriptional regulator
MDDAKPPPGRPRAFDADKALDKALRVFWAKGYEGATLADLTRAMGINPPSLYAAFGNKEGLFRKALGRYTDDRGRFIRDCLAHPRARAALELLLAGSADALTDPDTPHGCLVVQGALSCGESADPVKRELADRRAETEEALRERLKRARAEGELPQDCDPAALSRYFVTVLHGMAVQAASGASRKELRQTAKLALSAWPEQARA